MNFWNEKVLRESMADYVRRFGKTGLGEKVAELEARISQLETRKKPGRPRKEDA